MNVKQGWHNDERLELTLLLRNYETNNQNPEGTLKRIYAILEKINTADLTELCVEDHEIYSHLQHARFDKFWLSRLAKFPLPGDPAFHFQPQPNLSNMEFVLGYSYYVRSLVAPSSFRKMSYLLQALSHHSIHSMQTLTHLLMFQQESSAELYSSLNQTLIPILKQAALHHETPSYLLVAKIYYFMATNGALKIGRKRREDYFYAAIKSLEQARLKLTHSSAAIHNAYFGAGIAMSNPFEIANIDELMDLLINKASDYLTSDTMTRAKRDAHNEVAENPVCPPKVVTKQSPLFEAVLHDDIDLIRKSAKRGNWEERNQWGETPLMVACRLGHIASVRCLLQYAALEAEEFSGYNALHYACVLGHIGIARLLSQKQPELLDTKASCKLSPYECSHQPITLGGSIFKSEVTSKIFAETNTLLANYVTSKDLTHMREALKNGANPNFMVTPEKTALAFVIEFPELVAVLLEFGVDVNKLNNRGESVLFDAYASNQIDTMTTLLKLGADPNIKNNFGQTLLIKAVRKRDIATIQLLLKFGADVNLQDKMGHSALYYAAMSKENHIIIDKLLEHGADPCQKTTYGKAILDVMAEHKYTYTPKPTKEKIHISSPAALFQPFKSAADDSTLPHKGVSPLF